MLYATASDIPTADVQSRSIQYRTVRGVFDFPILIDMRLKVIV